ncbi:amino acid ABC transporter permease, partial [Streptomyces laculatispora]|nr:amino acid ABC transporter permease [Streptomyces laculatispora]
MIDIEKSGPADQPPAPPTPAAGPEAIKAIPVRHYGRYVSAAVPIAAPVAIIYAFSQGKLNWGAVPDYFF